MKMNIYPLLFCIALSIFCSEAIVIGNDTNTCPHAVKSKCEYNFKPRVLRCIRTNFTSIPDPKGIIAWAPPSRALKFYMNRSCVRYINHEMLKYRNLTVLNLSGNFIQKLQTKAFQTLNELLTLDLSRNQINYIEDSPFAGLGKLKDLRLDGNDLTSLKAKMFEDVTNLEMLILSNNRLDSISSSTFKHLGKLQELDLSGNQLKDFGSWHLSGLAKLRILHLQDNQLQGFNEVSPSPDLEELNLSNNNIQCLDNSLFVETKSLSVLNIRGNKLQIPKASWFRTMVKNDERKRFSNLAIHGLLTSQNSWNCNCAVLHYMHFLHDELEGNRREWKSILNVKCSAPERLKGQTLSTLSRSDIIGSETCSTEAYKKPCPSVMDKTEPKVKNKTTNSEDKSASNVGNNINNEASKSLLLQASPHVVFILISIVLLCILFFCIWLWTYSKSKKNAKNNVDAQNGVEPKPQTVINQYAPALELNQREDGDLQNSEKYNIHRCDKSDIISKRPSFTSGRRPTIIHNNTTYPARPRSSPDGLSEQSYTSCFKGVQSNQNFSEERFLHQMQTQPKSLYHSETAILSCPRCHCSSNRLDVSSTSSVNSVYTSNLHSNVMSSEHQSITGQWEEGSCSVINETNSNIT